MVELERSEHEDFFFATQFLVDADMMRAALSSLEQVESALQERVQKAEEEKNDWEKKNSDIANEISRVCEESAAEMWEMGDPMVKIGAECASARLENISAKATLEATRKEYEEFCEEKRARKEQYERVVQEWEAAQREMQEIVAREMKLKEIISTLQRQHEAELEPKRQELHELEQRAAEMKKWRTYEMQLRAELEQLERQRQQQQKKPSSTEQNNSNKDEWYW